MQVRPDFYYFTVIQGNSKKIARQAPARRATQTANDSRNLESEHRPERDPQVVVCPIIKIKLVAHVEPQTDRPKMRL
jgi:hypothetical protein